MITAKGLSNGRYHCTRRIGVAVAVVAILGGAPDVFAADSTKTVHTSLDVAILKQGESGCRPTLIEHYTRHLLHELPPYRSGKYLLVTQRFSVGTGCFEGNDPATVKVDGQPIDVETGKVDGHLSWSFTSQGTEGRIDPFGSGDLYRINMRGCCADEATAKYFSLDTGRLVASSTVPLLQIQVTDIKENRNRFVGAESNVAASPQASVKAMATLFFGDDEGVLETVSISSHEAYGSEDWGVTELNFPGSQASIGLRSMEKASLHIVLSCRCDSAQVDLTIPVLGAGIDVDGSVIRNGPPVELKTVRVRQPMALDK
jgi:hypothetical protein